MKYGIIDMGSNSVRLMIAQAKAGKIITSEKTLEMTRLAQGVDGTGLLQEKQMQDTVEIIKAYRKQSEKAGAGIPMAFATSAVRDAKNGNVFAEKVFRETGVKVEIIPGSLEAELGFMGVLATLKSPDENILVVDIGGGSTECIVGSSKGIGYAKSLNVGTVRMTGRHVKTDPITEGEFEALKRDIKQTLAPFFADLESYTYQSIYGIGGTLTTAATMVLKMEAYDPQRVQGYAISLTELKGLIGMLKKMDQSARVGIPGLQPKRADVIMAGFMIMEVFMEALGIETFRSSDADNMEGILFKYLLNNH